MPISKLGEQTSSIIFKIAYHFVVSGMILRRIAYPNTVKNQHPMRPITIFIAAVFLTSFTIIPGTNWLTNFDQAKSEASQTKKFILLNFSGSDWCLPCMKLKTEFFASGVFIEYAEDNLILANADFPRLRKNQLEKSQVQHNEALAEKYNPSGTFPLTILLDATGKEIKQWDGIPKKSPEQFVDEIKKIVNAAN
jgi:thioredoxin-related protein